MAYTLYLAGFDVKDIHMTDLVSGREDLSDVSMIVFVGGFSNSDVLGSAKGWAGAFLYNPKAKQSLANFYNTKRYTQPWCVQWMSADDGTWFGVSGMEGSSANESQRIRKI